MSYKQKKFQIIFPYENDANNSFTNLMDFNLNSKTKKITKYFSKYSTFFYKIEKNKY